MKQVTILVCSFLWATLVFAQTEWTPIGPEGGWVDDITFHPNNPDILYVGGDILGGFYKSTDAGATWVRNPNFKSYNAWVVKIDPVSPEIIYAGSIMDDETVGLLKSTDGGDTWATILSHPDITSIAIDPSDTQTLYAAAGFFPGTATESGHGVWKSADGGGNWTQLGMGVIDTLNMQSVVVNPSNPDRITAGAYNPFADGGKDSGIFTSTDAGATWALSGLPGKDVWELAICPDADSIYFAATFDSVYRSTDSGATWQAMNINSGKFYSFFFSIKIAPSAGNIIYAGSLFGVFKSTDRGETWSPALNNSLPANRVWTLAIHPTNPDIVFMGQPGIGIWKSTDGAQSWQSANTGFRCHYTWEMQVDNHSNLYVGIYNELDNNFASVKKWDGVNSAWIELGNTGNQMVKELAIDPTNPQILYAGDINQEALGGTLYKSSNAGTSWSKIGIGLPETQAFVSALAVNPASPNVIYAGTALTAGYDGGMGIYKSTDGGLNFALSGLASSQIIKIIIHPDSPQIVYAATLNNLYKSSDAGESWQPLGLPNLPLSSLVMHPVNPQILFAGVYCFGVYKSTNGGVTWVPTSLDTGFVTSIVIDSVQPERMFAAGGELLTNGIFYGADGGETWEDFSDGLLNKEVSRLAIDPNLGVMYASTVGYGVYKRQMPIATSVADDLSMPDEFLLFQNYPNPFNPETTIQYELANTGMVTLSIYNLLGQEVRTLVSENQTAGSYSVAWNGKNDVGEFVTNGMYFYKLQVGESFLVTRKMVFLK